MNRTKPAYFVVELPPAATAEAYPSILFSCYTLGEALELSRRMNADAGYPKFGVRGNGVQSASLAQIPSINEQSPD